MKKLAILAAFLILAMVPMTVLAGHHDDNDDNDNGKLVLSDAYLSSGAFTKNFGLGSIDSVLDLEKHGVGFALSGLGKIGISDNFPLAAASGCADSVISGIYSDCSSFEELKIKFKNLGTQAVYVNVYMNTGFTQSGWQTCPAGDASCDIYWQGQWTYVGPGKTKAVKLDFSDAEAFNCDGIGADGCINGAGQPILRLDEVTNIGFQVADFDTGGPTATWLIVRGDD